MGKKLFGWAENYWDGQTKDADGQEIFTMGS